MRKQTNPDILEDGLPKILSPSENGVFQAIFTLPEAEPALISAVSAFLSRTIKSVKLRANEMPISDTEAKSERLDINCVFEDDGGDQCGVEMQASPMIGDKRDNDHRSIKWRSVFNLCDLHSNQSGKGIEYGNFVKSYQVMLCNYKVFSRDSGLAERFTYRNSEAQELCDATTILFIDLTKAKEIAKKPVSEMSDIEAWVVFLALASKPMYRRVINEIAEQWEGVAVANETLLNISQDPDERARLRSLRMKYMLEEHNKAATARLERELKEREERRKKRYAKRLANEKQLLANEKQLLANEKQLLANEKQRAEEAEEKLQAVLADKDAALADKDAEIARLRALLGEESSRG